MISKIIFWTSIFFIGYVYVGYPLLLFILSRFRTRPVRKRDFNPSVSFIITAYNEERRIGAKIENTLQQRYLAKNLEIIIASDCSTDRTDEIAKTFGPQGVTLVRTPERGGKENAQKCAVQTASGEVLIFSDVATNLPPDGVSNIVKNFNDRTVGCVSSIDRFVDGEGRTSGEGVYVRYEMLLRSLETNVNSLVGLSGSFFAARREICSDWAVGLPSDFTTLLNSVKRGLRGVLDRDSIGYYRNVSDGKKEYDRKVRTVLRGISALMKSLFLLNPLRYGLFSWQLFSHKLCRWLVPFALGTLLISNVFLAGHAAFYLITLIVQIAFYSAACAGAMLAPLAETGLFRIPSFFVLVNLSILHSWYLYLRGKRLTAWEPTRRPEYPQEAR